MGLWVTRFNVTEAYYRVKSIVLAIQVNDADGLLVIPEDRLLDRGSRYASQLLSLEENEGNELEHLEVGVMAGWQFDHYLCIQLNIQYGKHTFTAVVNDIVGWGEHKIKSKLIQKPTVGILALLREH